MAVDVAAFRQAGWERTSYLAMACLLTFEYCELSFSNFYFAAIMLIFGSVLQLGNEVSIVNALELVFMPDPATHLPHQVEYFWVRPFLAVTCERPAEGAYPQQKRWSFGKCLFLWVRPCPLLHSTVTHQTSNRVDTTVFSITCQFSFPRLHCHFLIFTQNKCNL